MNSSYKTVLVHIESSMLIVCDGAQALWYPDILAVNRAPSRLFLTVSSSPERVLTGCQSLPPIHVLMKKKHDFHRIVVEGRTEVDQLSAQERDSGWTGLAHMSSPSFLPLDHH